MHPDKNCKFLAPCLLVLMFATLPLFCEQAFSIGGVGWAASSISNLNPNSSLLKYNGKILAFTYSDFINEILNASKYIQVTLL